MKLKSIHPLWIDIAVIALIGISVYSFILYDILEFMVPVIMGFYYIGKWVQKKFGTENECIEQHEDI